MKGLGIWGFGFRGSSRVSQFYGCKEDDIINRRSGDGYDNDFAVFGIVVFNPEGSFKDFGYV